MSSVAQPTTGSQFVMHLMEYNLGFFPFRVKEGSQSISCVCHLCHFQHKFMTRLGEARGIEEKRHQDKIICRALDSNRSAQNPGSLKNEISGCYLRLEMTTTSNSTRLMAVSKMCKTQTLLSASGGGRSFYSQGSYFCARVHVCMHG